MNDGLFYLSEESIRKILRGIDQALSNLKGLGYTLSGLDSPKVPYAEPRLYRSDLIDYFIEERSRLFAQLEALCRVGDKEDMLQESLDYTYQIEAARHGVGHSI